MSGFQEKLSAAGEALQDAPPPAMALLNRGVGRSASRGLHLKSS
ncbi:hypothetical protein ABGB07_28095 [Micromonosporaceae bacterium B7E4]